MKNNNLICETCMSVGKPKRKTRGSIFIEILLWLCILLPGVIYSLWRLTTKYSVCSSCGSTVLIPANSPRGMELSKGKKQVQA